MEFCDSIEDLDEGDTPEAKKALKKVLQEKKEEKKEEKKRQRVVINNFGRRQPPK